MRAARSRVPDLRSPRVWLALVWSALPALHRVRAACSTCSSSCRCTWRSPSRSASSPSPPAESAARAGPPTPPAPATAACAAGLRRALRLAQRAPGLAHGDGGRPRARSTSSVGVLFTLLLLEAARRHTGPRAGHPGAAVRRPTPSSAPGCRASSAHGGETSLKLVDQQTADDRGHLRHPHARVGDVHLPVRALRRRHGATAGCCASSPTAGAGGGGRDPGRGGEGRRDLERALRHRERQRHRQRGDRPAPSRSRS